MIQPNGYERIVALLDSPIIPDGLFDMPVDLSGILNFRDSHSFSRLSTGEQILVRLVIAILDVGYSRITVDDLLRLDTQRQTAVAGILFGGPEPEPGTARFTGTVKVNSNNDPFPVDVCTPNGTVLRSLSWAALVKSGLPDPPPPVEPSLADQLRAIVAGVIPVSAGQLVELLETAANVLDECD